METYYSLCYLAALAMLIAYINSRVGSVQSTITITAASIVLSLVMILLGETGLFNSLPQLIESINAINFQNLLLHGMLGFLLFAGGLGINLKHLASQGLEIAILALFSTLLSSFLVASLLWWLLPYIGLPLDFIYCLLFGALISPTDPIAVLAIVKKMNAPQQIAIQVEGESLFNDGFGLVMFVSVFGIAFSHQSVSVPAISWLFLHEAGGGVIYSFVLGLVANYLIKHTEDDSLELLVSLAIPTAGFVFAEQLGVSGALAMVVAGIYIGNITRERHFTQASKQSFDHLWHVLEEFLNNLLFLLIGLVLISFVFHLEDLWLMLLAIPLVLLSRLVSVALPYLGFSLFRKYNPMSVPILTWGGLRGGLALAMAMSVPAGVMVLPEKNIDVREMILVMTYAVVVFSILVQGASIVPLINKSKSYYS
ncbi:sodium:proton antiporter [Agarivorans sp. Alg241-V36]|uniref:cation:proton antiporter n=1 Tax=Agarivorans sp. Alg241-V36 TaxID=2305992 RepID=UPI0013D7F174|nr:sodium:proton antiporter [Agarivorans sp. Alg241-V36]